MGEPRESERELLERALRRLNALTENVETLAGTDSNYQQRFTALTEQIQALYRLLDERVRVLTESTNRRFETVLGRLGALDDATDALRGQVTAVSSMVEAILELVTPKTPEG